LQAQDAQDASRQSGVAELRREALQSLFFGDENAFIQIPFANALKNDIST
jgi:hypothetical protein